MTHTKCQTHGTNCNSECTDPNIDNGMMTKIWGPPGWLFLHCITFGYPYKIIPKNEEHIKRMEDTKNFFKYLGYVMPCKYCRLSYQEFIKQIPIEKYLTSRDDLTYWLYLIHNKVNNKLEIPNSNIPTFEEVQDKFETFRAKCTNTKKDEKEDNITKGCIKPADGTTKRCFLKIINCKNGDVTRRKDAYYTNNTNDYILIKREYLIFAVILIIILIIIVLYQLFGKKLRQKQLFGKKLTKS